MSGPWEVEYLGQPVPPKTPEFECLTCRERQRPERFVMLCDKESAVNHANLGHDVRPVGGEVKS